MDAIDQFINLFNSKEDFINAFLQSTIFLPQEVVKKQNEQLLTLYKKDGKFPVRYSPSVKDYWNVSNKKEAKKYTRNNEVSLKGYPDLNVQVDNDGNTEVRKLIKEHFGHKVSVGKQSTIKNYTISHVWGMATHPLFFTSLWNVVLIPTHFNYLMDKSDNAHPMVEEVKSAVKQKCIELYSPYHSFLKHFEIEDDIRRKFKSDSTYQTDFQFDFITHIDSKGTEEITLTDSEKEEVDRLLKSIGKTFFIDNFDVFANEEDPDKNIPVGEYTYDSYKTRISKMNKIFRENLEAKALKRTLGSRLDEETLNKAEDLFELHR